MSKVFIFDYDRCNGCRACQVACKDEFCNQPWPPYSEAQPLTGQFWTKITDRERGQVPWVKVSYDMSMCNHCKEAKCMAACPDAVYRRDDGFVIIDPAKARGHREIADACPHVFWNETLGLPQKCTGCAHLLDDGWEVPRCVDVCATGALTYVDESEVDKEKAVQLNPGSKFYIYNLPKRFVVGTVVDLEEDEVVIGAAVELKADNGVLVALQKTDDFGDFKFDQVDARNYTVVIHANGETVEVPADVTRKDLYVGDIDVAVPSVDRESVLV